MALPSPTSSFTIPSLYDDLELDCRIYYPRNSQNRTPFFGKGFAIIAHPYAPLGGSYDDPVVALAGGTLLRSGIVLGTFNFRGANGSAGRTSWSGKPEAGDYVAFYGFMLCFINSIWSRLTDSDAVCPLLIMGGYSFGSLIASNVPPCQYIIDMFQHSQNDSAENEIRSRATQMGKDFIAYTNMSNQSQIGRGRSSLRVEDATTSPNRVIMGGYGSESASRRISRDSSRRSLDADKVRQSIDRVRHKLKSREGSQQELFDDHKLQSKNQIPLIPPNIAYLLISPLLPPIAGLLSMFSPPRFERKSTMGNKTPSTKYPLSNETLARYPTCCVYGDKDVFTSYKKLRKWVEDQQARTKSTFFAYEIEGAGHFWQEAGAVTNLQSSLKEWLRSLMSDNVDLVQHP